MNCLVILEILWLCLLVSTFVAILPFVNFFQSSLRCFFFSVNQKSLSLWNKCLPSHLCTSIIFCSCNPYQIFCLLYLFQYILLKYLFQRAIIAYSVTSVECILNESFPKIPNIELVFAQFSKSDAGDKVWPLEAKRLNRETMETTFKSTRMKEHENNSFLIAYVSFS